MTCSSFSYSLLVFFLPSLSLMYTHSCIHFLFTQWSLYFAKENAQKELVSMRIKSHFRAGRTGEDGETQKKEAAWRIGWIVKGSSTLQRWQPDGPRQSEESQKGQVQLRLAGFCHSRKKWQWLEEAQGRRQDSWRRWGEGREMTVSLKISH